MLKAIQVGRRLYGYLICTYFLVYLTVLEWSHPIDFSIKWDAAIKIFLFAVLPFWLKDIACGLYALFKLKRNKPEDFRNSMRIYQYIEYLKEMFHVIPLGHTLDIQKMKFLYPFITHANDLKDRELSAEIVQHLCFGDYKAAVEALNEKISHNPGGAEEITRDIYTVIGVMVEDAQHRQQEAVGEEECYRDLENILVNKGNEEAVQGLCRELQMSFKYVPTFRDRKRRLAKLPRRGKFLELDRRKKQKLLDHLFGARD